MRHDWLTRLRAAVDTAAGTSTHAELRLGRDRFRSRILSRRLACLHSSFGANRLPVPERRNPAVAAGVALGDGASPVGPQNGKAGEKGRFLENLQPRTRERDGWRHVSNEAENPRRALRRFTPLSVAKRQALETRHTGKRKGFPEESFACDPEPPQGREWTVQPVSDASRLLGGGASVPRGTSPPYFWLFSPTGRRFFHDSGSPVGPQNSELEREAGKGRAFSTQGAGQQRAEVGETCRSDGFLEGYPGSREAGMSGRERDGDLGRAGREARTEEDALWRKEADYLSPEARKLQCLYHRRSSYLRGEDGQTARPVVPAWLRQKGEEKEMGEEESVKLGTADGGAVCVVLVNLGSPSAPTYRELWKYLNQFLGDPRVVEVPCVLWFFIRHAFILPFRSFASAQKYQSIWNFDPCSKSAPRPQAHGAPSLCQSLAFGSVRRGRETVHSAQEHRLHISQGSLVEEARDTRCAKGKNLVHPDLPAADSARRSAQPIRSQGDTEADQTARHLREASVCGRSSTMTRVALHETRKRDFSGSPAPLVRISEALRSQVQARFDALLDEKLGERDKRGGWEAPTDRAVRDGDRPANGCEGRSKREKESAEPSMKSARFREMHAARHGGTNGRGLRDPAGIETPTVDLLKEGARRLRPAVRVLMGMRYGEPSLPSVLRAARDGGCRKLLILPLYPQTAAATTSSVYDAAMEEIMKWRVMPDLRILSGYADHPAYISALATTIRRFWEEEGGESERKHANEPAVRGRGEKLVFSFHGIPLSTGRQAGEIYQCLCAKTARLVADQLEMQPEDVEVAFQSRFGPAEWTQPYIDQRLEALAGAGYRLVDVVMPGFATDCLETIEEMAGIYRGKFLQLTNGEGELRVIPCLNASDEATAAVFAVAKEQMTDWLKLMEPTP
ncbi:Ferrochelatase, related [Neospora caninum Liverpool]|uniref:Ferrochelatase, related n=1 Tax=Neospora caninum (strain Liverpool) TaxID=572307 RepID=F0VH03_NEOCL|nr:Ferrochelatase, related [Neospora caninum Liverpool]CBZ52997.1 Ferrochelatase, related [Neospora caninum Liverpool]CEL66982.1 TPA: Ferrochelatase, related [Neospora caninum Liverpool]|eukprot:XP_003883029.1 Ferrochelatase, related [Neospora caninum Liverpool]